MKFQEELVETLVSPATLIDDTVSEIMYRVVKFGEDHQGHFIRFTFLKRKLHVAAKCLSFQVFFAGTY